MRSNFNCGRVTEEVWRLMLLDKLSGVFAPLVTPFSQDDLDLDALRFNLRRAAASGLLGYLALGSNGENKNLTDGEQRQVLEVIAAEKADKVVMVGCGCESTVQTIAKCKQAAELGFEFASVLTPSYFAKRMDGPTLSGFYKRVADASPLPVLLYNAPGFAGGVQIPLKTVVELSGHPNIVGIKDSSSAGPGGILSALDPKADFRVLAGSVGFFYASLHMGATGGIVSLADAMPEPCCELYRLFVDGRYPEAAELHQRLSRLNRSVSGFGGVAGVKGAMDICGYRGGSPRHPLMPLDDAGRESIRRAILAEGFEVG